MNEEVIGRILLIEDNEDDYVLTRDLIDEIVGRRFTLDWIADYNKALIAIQKGEHDVYLIDYLLGERNGLDLLTDSIALGCTAPLILLTGQEAKEVDMAALRVGAADFLHKEGLDASTLERAIRYAMERARTQKALVQSELRYRSVLNDVREVIFQVEGEILTYLNNAWINLSGYTLEESLGRPLADFIYPEDRFYIDELLPTLHLQIDGRKKELRIVSEKGSTIWIEFNARALLNEKGKVVGLTGSLIDINAHKEAEEKQARLLDELASAVRAKDAFLASMSHELRTPLNAILGKTEILIEGVYGMLTHHQLLSLHAIMESGRHLLELINDILDLSKIEAGKIDLEIHQILVEPLVRSTLRQVQEMARKKEIVLYSMQDESVGYVQADERRLRQILLNLLSNAIKFTPTGGEVGVEVEVDQKRGIVYFHVRDTGIGISETDLERLFQRFVQIDNSLSREQGGTGLGLALVQHLTEMHHGEVIVESTEGRGSCFTVALPWGIESKQENKSEEIEKIKIVSAEPPASKNISTSHHPYHILLAEDNEMNITMVTDYLQVKGFEVEIAHDGAEAIEIARHTEPDLILMDMQMPHVDGLEAIRRIRELPQHRETPIIGLTALAMPGDRERCLDAGANDYLSKPVSLRHLLQRILAQLKQGKPI